MTDPTAKGYAAEPDVEEGGKNWFCTHGILLNYPCIECEEVFANKLSKLPAKAAPEPKDGIAHTPTPWVRDTTCGAGCDIRASNGRKIAATYGVANIANTHEGRMKQQAEDRANADLIIRAVNAYKSAPESEDEAFERFWKQLSLNNEELREAANLAWNARARMDAERGR